MTDTHAGTAISNTTTDSVAHVTIPQKEKSGAQWVDRYSQSVSTSDLIEPFRGNVDRFIAALNAGGANVSIAQTYRPIERAYLMYWSYKIANGTDPATADTQGGVDIDWQHLDNAGQPNRTEAQTAAEAMVSGYHIRYPPAAPSDTEHNQRTAIDMTITSYESKAFTDGSGHSTTITNSTQLYALGATYGVVKLVADPPHWSIDGH